MFDILGIELFLSKIHLESVQQEFVEEARDEGTRRKEVKGIRAAAV